MKLFDKCECGHRRFWHWRNLFSPHKEKPCLLCFCQDFEKKKTELSLFGGYTKKGDE